MKLTPKRLSIVFVSAVLLLILGKLAIQHFEKEANVGLAKHNLRQLGLAWEIYSKENDGRSPSSIESLIADELLSDRLFTYHERPTCRAKEVPMIVYNGREPFSDLDSSTILATQRWSDNVLLTLYADMRVTRESKM